MIKIPLWIIIFLFLFSSIFVFYGYIKGKENNNLEQTYSIIRKLEKVQQVVFLSAGIQTVKTKKDDVKIPWTKLGIPLTDKKAIIILNYNVKFGIKKPVKIVQIGEHRYKITIPKYEVIGSEVDQKSYRVYDSTKGLLSFSTKDIDTGEIVVNELSNKDKEKFLEDYKGQLDESA